MKFDREVRKWVHLGLWSREVRESQAGTQRLGPAFINNNKVILALLY